MGYYGHSSQRDNLVKGAQGVKHPILLSGTGLKRDPRPLNCLLNQETQQSFSGKPNKRALGLKTLLLLALHGWSSWDVTAHPLLRSKKHFRQTLSEALNLNWVSFLQGQCFKPRLLRGGAQTATLSVWPCCRPQLERRCRISTKARYVPFKCRGLNLRLLELLDHCLNSGCPEEDTGTLRRRALSFFLSPEAINTSPLLLRQWWSQTLLHQILPRLILPN